MNGKERLINILHGKPTNGVSWTTIADDITRQNMPLEYSKIPIHDFYKKIGCDILQFGGYSMPDGVSVEHPYKIENGYIGGSCSLPDGSFEYSRELGGKKLINIVKNGHPVKYPVQTKEDLELLLSIWQSTRLIRYNDEETLNSCEKSYDKINETIGNGGIYAPTLNPSPVQNLLENECGVENFYELIYSYPDLMKNVIDTMFETRREEYRALAETSPFECIIPIENTSTALISPTIYREFSLLHMREFSEIMHKNGKKAVVHMCGHLLNLLPELKETGIDGIHTLTSPPIGDCPFETALDVLGENLIIIGTLDGTVFQSVSATAEDIKRCVENTLTPRIKASNFILLAVADGIPTDVWRFEAVRDAAFGLR